MGLCSNFDPALVFCGVIYADDVSLQKIRERLTGLWGPVDLFSDIFFFTQTSYYSTEMGDGLKRCFITFEQLFQASILPELKQQSNLLELEFSNQDGKRLLNLDPGILTWANVLIATTKNHYHRVPLRDGVYAHIEYVFRDGDFYTLPWTYPDFQSKAYMDFFRTVRQRYKIILSTHRKNLVSEGERHG